MSPVFVHRDKDTYHVLMPDTDRGGLHCPSLARTLETLVVVPRCSQFLQKDWTGGVDIETAPGPMSSDGPAQKSQLNVDPLSLWVRITRARVALQIQSWKCVGSRAPKALGLSTAAQCVPGHRTDS